MINWSKRKKSSLVGVDIGASSLKILELELVNDKFRVESYAIEKLHSINNNTFLIKDVIKALNVVCNKTNIAGKQAALSVSGLAAISKVIQLPNYLNDEEILDEISFNADRYIPYPIDEVCLDFERLEDTLENNDLCDVLVVFAKNKIVYDRFNAVKESGLKPKYVDTDPFAIERAFKLIAEQLPEYGMNKVVGLVEVGASTITMLIFNNLKKVFLRSQMLDGNSLSSNENKTSENQESFILSIIQEISRNRQYYLLSGDYKDIELLVLTGGNSLLPNINISIENSLGIKTIGVNPFVNMQMAPTINAENLHKDSAFLMVSCGLALRKFE